MPIFFHFTMDRMYTCCTFTSEIKDYYYIIITNIYISRKYTKCDDDILNII